jgi:hypothetical protein
MVDRIRIGEHGYAMVVGPRGELIGPGDPDRSRWSRSRKTPRGLPDYRRRQASTTAPVALEYTDASGTVPRGRRPVASLGWTVIVERRPARHSPSASQPTRQLVVAISITALR